MDANTAASIIYKMQTEFDEELGWLLHKLLGYMFEQRTRYAILYVKDIDSFIKEQNLPKTSQQYVDEVCKQYNYEHIVVAHCDSGELVYKIRIPRSEMKDCWIG